MGGQAPHTLALSTHQRAIVTSAQRLYAECFDRSDFFDEHPVVGAQDSRRRSRHGILYRPGSRR